MKKSVEKKVCKTALGLTFGVFFALLHAVWALLVGLGVGQRVIDWILPLHFIDMAYGILPFKWGTAMLLVALAFVGGFVMGWILAALWNFFAKN